MPESTNIDPQKAEDFAEKAVRDFSAAMTTGLAVLGDRLGLFNDLATHGPSTAAELASRVGIDERYAREWLGGMANAGYLEYDADRDVFTLPPEHAGPLADEGGPHFMGGVYQMFPALLDVLDEVEDAFREGGGVAKGRYPDALWDGMERFSATWFNNFLLQEWLPAMPDVEAKLEAGARMADVGCGRGRALITLARAFPQSNFVGYDVFDPSVVTARANASEAGVADRVEFHTSDVSEGLHREFDIISTFDVIHDAVHPLGLLRAIRKALKDDGIYVCLDINCSESLEENHGPLGAMFHGFSIFYCMTTSLARDGAGLGTLGFHEPKVRELCDEAGFSGVRRVPLDNPFNNLYEIRR